MARITAFALLTCAAFAWVPPGIDRAGLAALGLAFMAWSIGRGIRLPFQLVPKPSGPAALPPDARAIPLDEATVQAMAREMHAELAGMDDNE